MEVVIDCYFDQIFSEMERSSLLSRYKRRALVNYFTAIIQGCARGESKLLKNKEKGSQPSSLFKTTCIELYTIHRLMY